MWRIEQALERIVGKKPAWMRAPYGSYNDVVREVAYQRGQSCTSISSKLLPFLLSSKLIHDARLIYGCFSGSVGLRLAGCKSFQLTSSTYCSLIPISIAYHSSKLQPRPLVILLQQADGATVDQSKALYNQTISQNPRNLLPLNHETHNTTAYVLLPYILNLFQSQGYQLVTLAECLNLPAYQQETEPSVPDVSSFYLSFVCALGNGNADLYCFSPLCVAGHVAVLD